MTARKETSGEHHLWVLKEKQRKSTQFFLSQRIDLSSRVPISSFLGGCLLGAVTSFLSGSLQVEAGKTRVYVTGPWGEKQSVKAAHVGSAYSDQMQWHVGTRVLGSRL